MMDLLFGFNGRIRRLHYWLAGIGAGVALGFVYAVVAMLLGGAIFASRSGGGAAAGGLGLIAMLLFLAIAVVGVWIALALQIKRWHDRDKGAIWVLINLIPFIGGLWALIECGFMDGTPGPNRFGPSPKGLTGAAAATAPAA